RGSFRVLSSAGFVQGKKGRGKKGGEKMVHSQFSSAGLWPDAGSSCVGSSAEEWHQPRRASRISKICSSSDSRKSFFPRCWPTKSSNVSAIADRSCPSRASSLTRTRRALTGSVERMALWIRSLMLIVIPRRRDFIGTYGPRQSPPDMGSEYIQTYNI